MPDYSTLAAFLAAALVLAAIPGPGLLYIVGRTLAGGRAVGYASSLGTALGGLVHVVAGVIGVSALVVASATAFIVLKLIGGIYLIVLAIQTWRSAARIEVAEPLTENAGIATAFRDGAIVEATNPKTAAFFLALIPQFIDPSHGSVAVQFLALGAISIGVNTATALLVATGASRIRERLFSNTSLMRRVRQGSAIILGSLGLSLLLTRRPA
jgi:threonine/homoserine/homoserine lactone efflux protein